DARRLADFIEALGRLIAIARILPSDPNEPPALLRAALKNLIRIELWRAEMSWDALGARWQDLDLRVAVHTALRWYRNLLDRILPRWGFILDEWRPGGGPISGDFILVLNFRKDPATIEPGELAALGAILALLQFAAGEDARPVGFRQEAVSDWILAKSKR